jgi:hypothetical protein
MFVASSHGKKMEEQERWAREEEEQKMRGKVEEEGHKIEGEGGVGWQWRALCSASSGGTCSWSRAATIAILVVAATVTATARAAAWTRSLRIANVQQKRTRVDQDSAKEREDDSRVRHVGIWMGESCGGDDAGIPKLLLSRILSSAKTIP